MPEAATTVKANGTAVPKITLYTNHLCPWAHRAHIVLRELGLPYEEVIIDLDRPREEWYLKINPRGLVPSIIYDHPLVGPQIITESAIVSTFLADAHPSPSFYLASRSTPTAALERARMAFFVDTYTSKVSPLLYASIRAEALQEKEEKGKELVGVLEKEVEPLLKGEGEGEGKGPFFGGGERITLAEALTAPFILRLYSGANDTLLPKSLLPALEKLPNFNKWAKAVMKQESVTYIWDADTVTKRTEERMEKMRKEGK
ncbi:MAG: hypothetical protein M1827_005668 [Pycnora praestabilis]|nr:MAG: hypothetical protein M1827_005668 [Pycnora praestabilis]